VGLEIAIIHYNTPTLTLALVRSIWRQTPGCSITIFDNSDREAFPPIEDVRIIDNTRGQVIDFEAMIASYPEKEWTGNRHGSEKHIASVDTLFDILPGGFILVDSDTLLKRDVSELWDESVAWCGMREREKWVSHTPYRLAPYLLYINVPMLREHGIRFRHEGRFFKLGHVGPPYYDTGASLLEDCDEAGLPGREVQIFDYVDHFGGASYKPGVERDVRAWLYERRHLYQNTNIMDQNTKKVAQSANDRILVVIPYCSEGAQGRELEYAVAGWRRHFKEPYLIVIAGEDHPVTKTGDDIICIPSERVPPREGQYRQHLDYVSCFRKVRAAFPQSEGFIFVADDVYAVNDFDMADVKFLKQNDSDIQWAGNTTSEWGREAAKTKARLLADGYPARNFTTHLPQWFEWEKLEALWERYHMDTESYVFEDLYYNIYFKDRIPFQLDIDSDNLKCGVYRGNPRMSYIQAAFRDKIWIHNSVEGWIPALDQMLNDYYFPNT
jgi:hypothetical protein